MSSSFDPHAAENCQSIKSIADLIQIVEVKHTSFGGHDWIYRGQSRFEDLLIPGFGRSVFLPLQYTKDESLPDDLRLFEIWKENITPYTSSLPENDFDCLAFAQHHGLLTRLLDWTSNPLVALFFAVQGNPDADGAFFVNQGVTKLDKEADSLKSLSGIYQFTPKPFHPRIIAQNSVLTVHSDPKTPLKPTERNTPHGRQDLPLKIRIPRAEKHHIRMKLPDYGIEESRLFPGMEGVASFLNWRYIKRFADLEKLGIYVSQERKNQVTRSDPKHRSELLQPPDNRPAAIN